MAMAMLDPDLKEEEVEELMAELDVDGNGTIEFDEFLVMMTKKEEKVCILHSLSSCFGHREQS